MARQRQMSLGVFTTKLKNAFYNTFKLTIEYDPDDPDKIITPDDISRIVDMLILGLFSENDVLQSVKQLIGKRALANLDLDNVITVMTVLNEVYQRTSYNQASCFSKYNFEKVCVTCMANVLSMAKVLLVMLDGKRGMLNAMNCLAD